MFFWYLERCTDINKDEDNSPKNRNNTNYNQTSSHTFRDAGFAFSLKLKTFTQKEEVSKLKKILAWLKILEVYSKK